jgi:hypothetical protein
MYTICFVQLVHIVQDKRFHVRKTSKVPLKMPKLFELKNFMEHFRILTIVDLSFVGTSYIEHFILSYLVSSRKWPCFLA